MCNCVLVSRLLFMTKKKLTDYQTLVYLFILFFEKNDRTLVYGRFLWNLTVQIFIQRMKEGSDQKREREKKNPK